MEENNYPHEEAKFNMALATLKRLDIILQQIKQLNYSMPNNSVQKQKSHVALVRELYIASYPLFHQVEDKEKLVGLKKEVIGLQIKRKNITKGGCNKIIEDYDTELENRLFEITIEIQSGLNKFFMPRGGEDDDDY